MRTGKSQIGKFSITEGMAFIMEDMETLSPYGRDIGGGSHPWLVTMEDTNVVEVVMCTTLSSRSQNKHRINNLDHDGLVDLPTGCPPMDPPSARLNAVSLDTVMLLPKKELFTHKLKLLNENTERRNFTTEGYQSLRVSENELKLVQDSLNEYLNRFGGMSPDPFGYQDAENNLWDLYKGRKVPNGFTEQSYKDKFDWEFLPEADPKAAYPAESKMHDYEKNDANLLDSVRKRDKNNSYRQRHFNRRSQRIENDDFTKAVDSIPTKPKSDDINK